MHYLVPVPMQYVDESGVPRDGGSVSVYRTGTPELAAIYQNSSTDELAENPSQLDSSGMWRAFVDAGIPLDYIVKDKGGNVIATYINISIDVGSGSGGVTKEYVDAQDDLIRESVTEISNDLDDERERAVAAEAAARTVVKEGVGISVTEVVKDDGHSEFTIDNEGVTGVEIASPNDTVSISKTKDPVTGVEHFNIEVNNTEGQYINIASDSVSHGTDTQTLEDDTRKYVPLADSELSGLVGRNGITLQDSEDDVVNAVAVLDHNRKYLCTAQVKVTVNANTNDMVNVDVFTMVGHQRWLAGSFSVDTTLDHSTSKTITWMVEGTDATGIQMALSEDGTGAEVEVEVKQLFIAEFSSITGTGGGGSRTYIPGDAINITDDTISVRYGYGLDIDSTNNKLKVSSEITDQIDDLKDNQLKIAPPEHEGVGTMLFYTGELI